jgi:hypothetical protein
MCDDHPWTLTAPWWRWPKVGVPGRDPRRLPPALQKYDSSDPVTGFVKAPQRALAFVGDDVVHEVRTLSPLPRIGPKRAKLSDYYLQPTGTRKVFLPSHKRFYLVVCELHCDTAGFPSVAREKVCEAGFVVRRRRLSFAAENADAARALVDEIAAHTATLARLERDGGARRLLRKRVRVGTGGVFGGAAKAAAGSAGSGAAGAATVAEGVEAAVAARKAEVTAALEAARAKLRAWKSDAGAVTVNEGWVASDFENVGSWQPLPDEPEAIAEVTYPLSPLVADPRDERHDARGKTLWFGLVPAGSRHVDAQGRARFDDASRYEVRCFVRRHRCGCPRGAGPNDCGGELVWSVPTEAFQLAPHFDPVGTGNHPVTIQMPDIPTLAATVGARLPVQMSFPKDSALNFGVDTDKGKGQNPSTNSAGIQICFFSIPLITIIATFVLNLFLPIVVLLFGLWFLLGLKFCIPPSLSYASLHADLSLKIEAALSVAVDIELDAALTGNLGADMNLAMLGKDFSSDVGSGNRAPLPGSVGATLTATFANRPLADLQQRVTVDHTEEVETGDVTAGLPWVPRVERWEVGA